MKGEDRYDLRFSWNQDSRMIDRQIPVERANDYEQREREKKKKIYLEVFRGAFAQLLGYFTQTSYANRREDAQEEET